MRLAGALRRKLDRNEEFCIINALDKPKDRRISPMKNSIGGRKTGFTMVEMLVVITIIGIIATVTTSSVRNAQRQARNARCQANMHSLHQASLAYYTDFGKYPAASAFEWSEVNFNGEIAYYETRGWINWLHSTMKDCRRRGDGAVYSYEASSTYGSAGTQSRATQFRYAGALDSDQRVRQSIEEGAIFRYTGKNHGAYCCPESKFNKGRYSRSYAMNKEFGYYGAHTNVTDLAGKSASRLAMFVEMEHKTSGATGWTAGASAEKNASYSDDSVWDYDKELIDFCHKGGAKTSNVIFADGHIEQISQKEFSDSIRDKIGKGSID